MPADQSTMRLETSRAAWCAFIVTSSLLVGVECTWLFPEGSGPRVGAAWFWVACSGLVVGWAILLSVAPFFRPAFWRSRDLPWFLAAYFIPVGLVLFDVNGWEFTRINAETALEVQNGYFYLTKTPDLGLFNMGFLSYPARQYDLAALPSLIWGKSLVAERMGYGGLYVVGYLAFLQATRLYLISTGSQRPMLLASLTGALVSMAGYPILFARLFEQTLVPISITLLFLAGLLLLMSGPGPLPGIWVAWALGFMPYSYTASYGIWALAMVVLGYLALSRPARQRVPLAACLAVGAAAFATSVALVHRVGWLAAKTKIGGLDNFGAIDWLNRMAQGFHATVGLEESLIPAPLLLGILFILFRGVRGGDFRIPFVLAWGAGSVVMALALKGYCWRVPEFDVHRAMYILPVLSLALGLYLSQHWEGISPGGDDRLLRGVIMAAILVMIANSAYLPFIRRAPRAFDPGFKEDPEEATMLVLKKAAPNPRTIFFHPPFNCDLDDNLTYFSPDTRIVRGDPPSGEHLPGNYVISLISLDPLFHLRDELVWHRNEGPFLKIDPE
jgi:hypothetical protein